MIFRQNPTPPTSSTACYVLFVTCLVGAVYGEDIWVWARSKFVPKNDNDRDGNGGGRDDGGEEQEPKPP